MDVRLYGSSFVSPVHYFNTQTSSTDGIARVATYLGNYTTATADIVDTTGLVTEFNFAAVPEPGAYGCFAGLGAFSIMGLSLRRKRY